MYSFHSRVRYSETDREGRLSLVGILNYLQDCSTFQSEDCGVGLAYLQNHNWAWVLNFWQVDILRYPGFGENIEIGTIPYSIKGFIGYRNFYIKDASGEMAVKANSIWTLLHLDTLKPVRVPQEMLDGYILGTKLDMEYQERKIRGLDGTDHTEDRIMVKRHHIDTNRHVNNAQYVSIALDYVEQSAKIRRLCAEYKKAAYLGAIMEPVVTSGDKGELVSLCDPDGNIYAKVLFDKG